MNKLKVFEIVGEGGEWLRVVEAPSSRRAVEVWRSWLIHQWIESGYYDPDTDDELEPEQIRLLSDAPVLRDPA